MPTGTDDTTTALGLDWVGLGLTGLDWIGLGWTGLDWVGLGWVELDRIGFGSDRIGWCWRLDGVG